MKWVADPDAVEGREKLAQAGVLDCSTAVAMNVARLSILLETIGNRASADDCARRHSKIRRYQPSHRMESRKDGTFAQLATVVGDQRLLVGWRLGPDLASLRIGVSAVLLNALAIDPVVRAFFHDMGKQGGIAKKGEDFLLHKPEYPIPITMT